MVESVLVLAEYLDDTYYSYDDFVIVANLEHFESEMEGRGLLDGLDSLQNLYSVEEKAVLLPELD